MADAWGISFGGTFIVWGAVESVTAATFGPPFLDRQSALLTTLGATNLLLTSIGTGNQISPDIELQTLVRSPRIDRSVV